MFCFVVGIIIFVYSISPAFATTYYVRTDGHNTNCNGTANASASSAPNCAFLTVQKAANTATAGDTVNIKAGTYYEKVSFPTSGSSGSPITFQGTLGSGGSFDTIIDGSQATSGWTVSSDYGGGLAYEASLGYEPGSMTSNGKTIWKLSATSMSNGTGPAWLGYAPTRTTSPIGVSINIWDGVDALFGYANGKTYLRFRNGDNPGSLNVRAVNTSNTGAAATLLIDGKSYITITNLLVRGGQQQVFLKNSADHITITGNYLEGGVNRIRCDFGGGCTNATISNNTLTLNGIGMQTYTPGDWSDVNYARAVNQHMYNTNKFPVGDTDTNDTSILLYQASSPTITGNISQKEMQGIAIWGTITGADIGRNTFQYHSDNAIYLKPDYFAGNIHDNLFIDSDHHIRFDTNESATHDTFVYRNKFWQPYYAGYEGARLPKAIFLTTPGTRDGTDLRIKIYHNTFAGGGWALDVGGNSGTVPFPGVQVVNNFLSTYGLSSWGDVSWQEQTHNTQYSTWYNNTIPDFIPPGGHPALDAGLDLLSRSWPGISSGYYVDGLPDIGAIQGAGEYTPTATSVAFVQQPSSTQQNAAMTPAPTVEVRDQQGARLTSSTATVTLAIDNNPVAGTLTGTNCSAGTCSATASNGLAIFPGLQINTVGTGYTLATASSGLTGSTSNAFSVTAFNPPPPSTTEVWWQLNEGTGTTAIDYSLFNLPGTIANATWTTGHTEGHSALQFAYGSATTVSNANFTLGAGSPITVLLWIKSACTGGTGNMGAFHIGPADQDQSVGAHIPEGNTLIRWHYPAASDGVLTATWNTDWCNTWIRVGFTAGGSQQAYQAIAVNGTVIGTVSSTAAPNIQLTGITLGQHIPFSGQHQCTCDIEDFRVLNRSYSSQDFATDYAENPPPTPVTQAQDRTWISGHFLGGR